MYKNVENRYFYAIEECGAQKEIHICGNIYFNDADASLTNHRIAEWTGLTLSIAEVQKMLSENTLWEYLDEKVAYLGDITRKEANDISNLFWNGEPRIELSIEDVTDDTPVGEYWFDKK